MDKKSSMFIEWKSNSLGIVRGGPGTKKFGDPYNFVCTITLNETSAYVEAACGEYNKDIREAIEDALSDIGVTDAKWERITSKGVRYISVKVKPKDTK